MKSNSPELLRRDNRTERFDGFLRAAFLLAVSLLLLVAGALISVAGVFPGPQIGKAYEAGKALYEQATKYDDVLKSDLWHPARSKDRGVTIFDPARAYAGLTLFTSGHQPAAYLMDMQGRVIHKWWRPYSTVWTPDAAVKRPQPDSHVYMRKARLDAEGNLLALYEGVGDTPYGYGLVKLDKDSNVIWRYLEHTHHDFDVAPDGRIFVLTQDFVNKPKDQFDKLVPPRLDDFLVILSPEGKPLRKIPLMAAVAGSKYRQLLYTVSAYAVSDPLHANTVHYITEKDARRFPYAKPGQILVSFRELGAIGVIDANSRRLVWAVRGYWLGQHDPEILPDGHILMFDNFGNFDAPAGRSRALEVDPRNMALIWQYAGTAADPLNSTVRSHVQRLPNGNTLITESDGGRILEVTPDKKVVWEYVNAVRAGPGEGLIPILCKAQRLDPKFVARLLPVLAPRHS